jgi:transglutaminase-like putative cysteine protease
MPRLALLSALLLLTAFSCAAASSRALREAAQQADAGEFAKAESTLSMAMQGERSEAQRRVLDFERERLSRIRKDYKLTKPELYSALTNAVRDLTEAEFEQWLSEGRFDSRVIDGVLRFVGTSVSNLFFRHPALKGRRLNLRSSEALDRALLENALAIQSAARREGTPYVLPKRFQVTMKATVKSNSVAPGETIRAWLPVPRRYPFQDQFEWLSSAPPMLTLSAPTSSIRSAYFEQVALTNSPTTFRIDYLYTAHGVCFEPMPSRVIAADLRDPELRRFTAEGPHVVFTGKMRTLSAELVGTETNAMLKARRCYEWISENIRYSFAREYSTLGNISDYCLTNRYGDCGQEALLFITLCRLNGIPARWQSGWNIFPGDENIHDWCEIYLAPYGWMPVDPYMGIHAMQYATSLTTDQKEALRNFYFGGLTQYRMIANSDHNQTLEPAKTSHRSDDVDFQRGELEAGGRNLYFDQFNYSLIREKISTEP